MKRSIDVGKLIASTWAALACCAVMLSAQQIEPSGQAPKPVAAAPAVAQPAVGTTTQSGDVTSEQLQQRVKELEAIVSGQMKSAPAAAQPPAATQATAPAPAPAPKPLSAAQIADLNARVDFAIDQAHGAGTGVCGPGKKGRKRELVVALDMETGRVSSHCEERFAK